MAQYEPQISAPERVHQEFTAAATRFEEAAREGGALTEEDLRDTVGRMTNRNRVGLYVKYLPFVHRFIVAELDTKAPSTRGIGRLGDGDPPPRIGAKYREQLADPKALQEIGLGVERTVLVGFASQAGFFDESLSPKPNDEVWAMWLRRIGPVFNETNELISKARKHEESTGGIIGAAMITLADYGGSELVEAFEMHGVTKGGLFKSLRNARPMSYFGLLLGAGRSLHHVLSDKVDEEFGTAQSLYLLEEYQQPRDKKQMVAEIQERG